MQQSSSPISVFFILRVCLSVYSSHYQRLPLISLFFSLSASPSYQFILLIISVYLLLVYSSHYQRLPLISLFFSLSASTSYQFILLIISVYLLSPKPICLLNIHEYIIARLDLRILRREAGVLNVKWPQKIKIPNVKASS